MCKGDGGRVLSNVELILPWNVVEACYTLERNDSTCFFAANDSEGTTSQISLCKLEDNSVKIQVTVTALEGDDNEEEELEGPSNAERDATKHKKFTLWGSDEDPSDRTPIRHQKRSRPDLDFGNELDQYGDIDEPGQRVRRARTRPRHVGQLKPTLMNKSLTAMWRKKKRRARQQIAAALARKGRLGKPGFNLKQARSILEKKGVIETARRTYGMEALAKQYPSRRRGREEPAMPVLEAVEEGEGEIDLDLIYKYGAQMRAFEERRRQEKANWEKVQEELKQGKEGVSMVIVLKCEGDGEVTKVYEEAPEVTPKLHVIEPLPTESEPQIENPDAINPLNEEDLSTQVIYIHTQSKDGLEAEDIDEGKKFFKRRRDKATRVAKDNGSSKGKPLWKQQISKKAFKVEPDRPPAPVDCAYCPRKFKDYSYLFRHVKGHHMDQSDASEYLEELKPKMKVDCPICEKSISSLANVGNHIKQCHPDQDTAVQCDLCCKSYKTPASLKQHIRQRHMATSKKYECAQCNMVFAERRGLTDHVNCVHETTQVFTCNKCWKVFLTKSRLRRHMYIHGEHRHICKDCGKGFHIKDNMNKHIRIVHEKNHGKMWKCSYCSKEFLVKGNMTQHIRGIHLKQFPFTCSKCQQGFRRMRDMMLHMEKCNEEENVSIEMFPKDVKEESPKKASRSSSQTPSRSTRSKNVGKSKRKQQPPPDSEEEEEEYEEEEEEEEYVIHDEMIVSGDEEEEDREEEVDEEEEYEGEDVETREVILNSNGGEDSMQLQIEQDGVVIPIEVVIGQNEGDTEGAEVIADGAVA